MPSSRSLVSEFSALLYRDLALVLREKYLLVTPLMFPLIYATVFAYAIAGLIEEEVLGVDYLSFLASGMAVYVAFVTSLVTSAVLMFVDRQTGFVRDLKCGLARPWLYVCTRLVSTMVITYIATIVFVVILQALGIQVSLLTYPALFLVAIALAAFSTTIFLHKDTGTA